MKIYRTDARLSNCSGATMVEFALIVPLLLILILGVVAFSLFFSTKSLLAKGAQEGLTLASVVPGLEELDEETHLVHPEIKNDIQTAALSYPLTGFLRLGQEVGGDAGTGENRIIAINIDVGEGQAVENNWTELTNYLSTNPMEIELVAVVKNPIWFMPDFTVRERAIGYREPRFFSTLPRPVDCNKDFVTFQTLRDGGPPPPQECVCDTPPNGVDPWRVYLNPTTGLCECFDPPFDSQYDNDGTLIACNCPGNMIAKEGTPPECSCPSCESQGWTNAHLNDPHDPSCACVCNDAFVEDPPGSKQCICPLTQEDCSRYGQQFNPQTCTCGATCNSGTCGVDDVLCIFNENTGACACNAGCKEQECEDSGQYFKLGDGSCFGDNCRCLACEAKQVPQNSGCFCNLNAGANKCECNEDCLRAYCHAQNKPYYVNHNAQYECQDAHCKCLDECPGLKDVNGDNVCVCPDGASQECQEPFVFDAASCACDCSIESCDFPQYLDVINCACADCPRGYIGEGEHCVCDMNQECDIAGQVVNPLTCACECLDGEVVPGGCNGEDCCKPNWCVDDCYWDGSEWRFPE